MDEWWNAMGKNAQLVGGISTVLALREHPKETDFVVFVKLINFFLWTNMHDHTHFTKISKLLLLLKHCSYVSASLFTSSDTEHN